MGLCKCQKKNVTNQFCFEHKVNVCDHCIASNVHLKCIIGPYLKWLEEASYQSICGLCEQSLSSQECVRLLCYHIFHVNCINQYALQQPSNTAPAGYTCVTCHRPIFGSSNTSSPLFTMLQNTLSKMSWARNGLGLPLIDNSNEISYTELKDNSLSNESVGQNLPQVVYHNPISSSNVPIAVNNISNFIITNNDSNFGMTSTTRNKSHDNESESRKSLLDIDDDKYRNKSPMEFLSRWMRSHATFANRRNLPQFTYRRWIIAGILIFIALCTIIHFFIKFGRENAEHDPMLDPKFNPNIRNEEIQR